MDVLYFTPGVERNTASAMLSRTMVLSLWHLYMVATTSIRPYSITLVRCLYICISHVIDHHVNLYTLFYPLNVAHEHKCPLPYGYSSGTLDLLNSHS